MQSFEFELQRREQLRHDLTAWAIAALEPQGFSPAGHHRLLLQELEAISRGGIDRLLVLMPPGSAKSTYASELFPAWWFTQHPDSSVIAASHTASLAEHFGRRVRNLVAEQGERLGYALAVDNRAAARWQTTGRGEYLAVGLRGPIAGRRADLAIIDDPVKSHADADSAALRDQAWDWFRADLATRLKPHGRIVLIMTRWHEDDLGGRLLARAGNEWRVLRLPALAEANDPLHRAPGAPLWPQWEDAAALDRKRRLIGERTWTALFQQSPRPATGSIFKVDALSVLDTPPAAATGRIVRAWDLAGTPDRDGADADWTAGVKLLREADSFTVLDVVRRRGNPNEIENLVYATALLDGRGVIVGLPKDPGQAGGYQIGRYTGKLAGYRIDASPERGSKQTRAWPVASQLEGGNLAVVRAGWNHALIEELRDFPYGRHDDQVDALSRAFAMLTPDGVGSRRLNTDFSVR